MQVYVSKDGQQYGPYTVEQLQDCVRQGNFTSRDYACYDGQNWVAVGEVPGFAQSVQPIAKPPPPSSRRASKPALKTSKMAIASLVCGILCVPIVSIVLGHLARAEVRRSEDKITGAGIALVGLLLGHLLILIVLGFVWDSLTLYLILLGIGLLVFLGSLLPHPGAKVTEEARAWVEELKSRKGIQPIRSDLMLKKGEVSYYNQASTLFETRAVRHYKSGMAGIRVAKGVYIGGSKGKSVSEQEWKAIDDGTLVITNNRLIFDGTSQNRSFKLDRILSVSQGLDKIELSLEGRQKSMVFSCPNPLICSLIIRICTTADTPHKLGEDAYIDIEIEDPK